MHHILIVTKRGWTQWMFLYFIISGTSSLVTVHQPPVLTSALGHDVIMHCQLSLSSDEKMVTPPVLYWMYLKPDTDSSQLWIPSEKYEGRVELLDNNRNSLNKSILFKNVQWDDSGKYLCKFSVNTERDKSFRRKGNPTLLMVHDTMTFNLTPHNDSLLWCEVNVTWNPAFVLSIFHDGRKLQTVDSASLVAALPHVTLSETISLRREGRYECQLHLDKDLITKSIVYYHLHGNNLPPVSGAVGDADKNVSVIFSTAASGEPGVVVFQEPWLLYAALLLVPITILLGLLTVLLMLSLSTSGRSRRA